MSEAVRTLATRRLIYACALWGLSFPAGKALLMVQAAAAPGHSTWLYTAAGMTVRFALAAAIVFAILCLRGRLRGCTKNEVVQGVGVALFGGLGMLFQLDGLAHTDASTSAFLTQGSVIFIPLITALLTRSLPHRREVMAVVLVVIGVAVLAGFDGTRMSLGRGEMETLIAALFFTGHILWLERPKFLSNDATRVSLIMFAGIAVLCLPLTWYHDPGLTQAVKSVSCLSAWWFLGILVGPCTLLAFLWMNRWQRHVTATTAGLIYCFEPVFASVQALFLPGVFSGWAGLSYTNETLTTRLLIGGALILMGNLIIPKTSHNHALNEHGV